MLNACERITNNALLFSSSTASATAAAAACHDVTSARLSSREFSAVHTASKPSRRRLAFRPITQTRSQSSVFMRGLLLYGETERRPDDRIATNKSRKLGACTSLNVSIYITLDHTGHTAEDNAFLQVLHYAPYS